MSKLFVVAALAATCACAVPAFAATDSECQAMWTKADVNNDGVLSGAESMRYAAAMRVHNNAQISEKDKITKADFMAACKNDVYVPHKADSGAPLKGANSFTERQAKDRAAAQGITPTGALAKDKDGIWRGQGTQDGKPVQVAIDYKGNVVTTAQQ